MDFVICTTANAFRIYILYKFVKLFLGETSTEKYKILTISVCFYFTNTALFWIFRTAWLNIACNLIGIAALVRVYTKSIKANLFVTCSVYLIVLGCDIGVNLSFIQYEDRQRYSQVYVAISVFVMFACELLAEKIVTNRRKTEKSQSLPLICVPLCSIALIHTLVYSKVCEDRGIAIVGIGLLAINYLMLYLYNQLLHFMSRKYELELLEQKVQIYANQLKVITQTEERLKALKHDMKHHLNEIRFLADRYGAEDILQYIGQMDDFACNPAEMIASGNLETDSVLNYMLQQAKERLKDVRFKFLLPEKMEHSFDINVILGNLLENAIEAAEQTEEKYLNLNISCESDVLKLRVENSFLNKYIALSAAGTNNRTFFTTKKQKEQHGIGLKNVRKIVEAHHGIMDIETEGNIFRVRLVLYMEDTV